MATYFVTYFTPSELVYLSQISPKDPGVGSKTFTKPIFFITFRLFDPDPLLSVALLLSPEIWSARIIITNPNHDNEAAFTTIFYLQNYQSGAVTAVMAVFRKDVLRWGSISRATEATADSDHFPHAKTTKGTTSHPGTLEYINYSLQLPLSWDQAYGRIVCGCLPTQKWKSRSVFVAWRSSKLSCCVEK